MFGQAGLSLTVPPHENILTWLARSSSSRWLYIFVKGVTTMKRLSRRLISLLLLLMLAGLALGGGDRTTAKCKAGTCCDTCLETYLICIDNGINPYACQLRYDHCAAACGGCQ